MKITRLQLALVRPVLAKLFLMVLPALGQGTFQNLDFESATIQQTQTPGDVSATSALPGWTVYYGTNQQATVWYNQAALGSTHVDLLGTNGVPAGFKSIEGEFSVLLQGGVSGSGPNLFATAASIKQMGVVPLGSRSIIFKALGEPGTFTVSIDAVNISYFALSNGPGYTVYGGDISSSAGKTAELEFALSRLAGTDNSNWNLDSIQFSDLAIPEPSVLHLLALGALVVASRVLRNER